MAATLNDPNAPGYVTRPRIKVLLGANGTEIPQCQAVSVQSNNHFQADRFTVSFVPTLTGTGTFAWWASQKVIPVDIQLGLVPSGATEPSSWVSMLIGEADKMTLEPGHNIVSLEGRDLTAHFIDNKNTNAYVNQSSSDIITQLATSRGLTAKVSNTTGTVGRYWGSDRETSSFNQSSTITTEWDLIVSLAKKEGYDAFVQGSVLYFKPETASTATPYAWVHKIDAQNNQIGNIWGLRMDRVLTVAKGLHVTVKSWHSKGARSFVKTSSTKASIGPSGKSLAQEYVIQHPNLTEDEAQTLADNEAMERARHELLISASMPGDMLLTPRTMVSLQGTGTAFDQVYYAASITKNISIQDGFVMHASCKNKASDDE